MTPERRVKNKVVKLLDAAGAYWFYPVQSGYGRAGIPDIIACMNGQFLGIECKAGKGKTTALQDKELQAIADAGGLTFVINEHNQEELDMYLNQMLRMLAT